jgi:hypothetical protein
MATPLNSIEEIHQRIADLQAELDASSPNIATSLLKIHSDLGKSPELLHILSEEEIATIAKGFKVQSNIQIVTAKPKAAKKENLKDLEI